MKSSTKYILGGVGLIFVAIICILAYGAYSIYTTLTNFGVAREVPDAIKEARVTVGGEFLHRSEMFKLEHPGWLSTILEGAKISDEKERERIMNSKTAASIFNFADIEVVGSEIVAAGEFGGYIFDLQGNLKKHVTFEPAKKSVKIGPIERDIWSSGLRNLTIARLDTERIGFFSADIGDGMRVFDSNGNEIWASGSDRLDLGKSSAESDK
ncbi:MAG TPA: hypothetical protein VJV05_14570, partial [Pyrinomonadaceae bacterium]|nr:hypothetical protein [Pyrinomonadaceae bacterium]